MQIILRIFVFSILPINSFWLYSQKQEDYLFFNQRFGEVLPLYQEQLKSNPENVLLNYKIGVCYLNSRSQKAKAAAFLEKAIFHSNDNLPLLALKYSGDAYFLNSRFAKAIESYEKFKKIYPEKSSSEKSDAVLDEVNRKIEMSLFAKELLESFSCPVEFGSMDKKYFEEGSFIPDSLPVIVDSVFERTEYEATIATSTDGQIILIYKNSGGNAELYTISLSENNWTSQEQLGKAINAGGWEQDEFISADGSAMYFTSEREGGFGGKDIYKCIKLLNGDWGKAKNLGAPVNTPFDEEAPFLHPDGTTLYFGSNRNEGLKIYTSELLNDGNWNEPEITGYPVKSDNENFTATFQNEERIANKKIILTPSETNFSNEISRQKENYLITFFNMKKAPLLHLKGKISAGDSKINITVKNNKNEEILGSYFAEPNTGNYSIILPTGINISVIYEAEGHLFYSENFDITNEFDFYKVREEIQLATLAEGSKTFLKNIFFDSVSAVLHSISHAELNYLFNFLKLNPDLYVEIAVFMESESKNVKTTAKIANDRAQAIVHYLIEKGIVKERVAAEGAAMPVSKKEKTIPPPKFYERIELKILPDKLVPK